MNKKMKIVSLAAGLVLVGAIAVGAANNDQTNSSKNVMINDQSKSEVLSIDKVKELVKTNYDGHIEEIEFEGSYYKVEVDNVNANDDVDVIVDAYTGDILAEDFDDRDDDSLKVTQQTQSNNTLLSKEEAIQIAEEKTGAKVIEIELDDDDNRLYYEIELKSTNTEIEMEIDAKTGKIIELEYDEEDDRYDD